MNRANLTKQNTIALFNQPPALENYNLFASDVVLQEAVERESAGWIAEKAFRFGELCGRAEFMKLGELANRFTRILKTHDQFGNRIDEVEFHTAYHELMRLGIENQTHNLPWISEQKGAHVARAALMFLKHQIDEGTSCPLTMTFAVVPSLRLQPELAAEWLPLIFLNNYDERFVPAWEKRGVTFGMAMTERQGGSDVRANTTFAKKISNTEYEITGHKWFCSAPMSDAFLVLAQAEKGLTCFLLPRFRPDGGRNAFHIQRLKDKLGNRSNASSEVEFHSAHAQIIGEEGSGVPTIIEMVRHTRLDCSIGSAATLRRAVSEITHHTAYRRAFGKRLIEQPLMQNVLADLCLESEAATALAFRLARSFNDENEKYFSRIVTAIGKFWICKRAIAAIGEAIECTGGNGYVEESVLPRLYRDIPVNSIWEGSGNVQCLDVLRAMRKEPETVAAIFAEYKTAQGLDKNFDRLILEIESDLRDSNQIEHRARLIVEKMALALQAAILLKNAPNFVAEAFCRSRLAKRSLVFGTLPADTDFARIIERSLPQLG